MARIAGKKFDAREFEKYMRDYDREAFNAGSQKDPSADSYMGDPDPLGVTRYFGDEKFLIEDGAPGAIVPEGEASFIRAIQSPEYIETFGMTMEEEGDDKGYETEEDRVSKAMAGGVPTIVNIFRDRVGRPGGYGVKADQLIYQ